ncbi:hypothetical protein PULV_a0593 [Pseudoalteromonas ulvae UL12]|uniref:DUF350 domain-containing protein n=1 Tax=Pseudoalteromonas ulvae TaxID=107327 RepID=UPI00186BABD0|nr:hypothetical protein [Pseudoalteromonas ulvae]MBE0362982.1 hypothetical protein [Pseudoalteromonas ulvae UL12]
MTYNALLQQALIALTVTFLITFIVILFLRYRANQKSEIGLVKELSQKDNFAVGISYAARIFTLTLIVGYLIRHLNFTDIQADLIYAGILISLAICFSYAGKQIHNKWVLSRFNEEQEILKRNVSAALVESSALLGNALIILGLYKWSHTQSVDGLIIVSLTFAVIQLFLFLHSRWQEYLFAKANQGSSLQEYLSFDNTALGLKYSSQTLSVCMAIYAALSFMPYLAGAIVDNILTALFYSAVFILFQQMSSALFTRLALPKVDTESEIDQQDNIGVASIELAIYLAIGLVLIAIFNP